jgi:hypothetical protein
MREVEDTAHDGINYEAIAPRDVIGFHVFNTDSGMGNGKVVGMRSIRGEANFVCEVGDKTVNRPVEQVMADLRKYGYDLCSEPWTVASAEEVGETGVDEAEIADRANESWQDLADEFGLTEDEVRDIIVGDA